MDSKDKKSEKSEKNSVKKDNGKEDAVKKNSVKKDGLGVEKDINKKGDGIDEIKKGGVVGKDDGVDKSDKRSKRFKNYSSYWIFGVLILVILLVGGFMFFSGDKAVVLEDDGVVVAIVNGEEVMLEEVEDVRQMFLDQGQNISLEVLVEQVINQKLILQEVLKGDYIISDEEAESIIEDKLSLQNVSLEDYKEKISAEGVSYEEWLDSFKQELATQEYLKNQFEGEAFNVSLEDAQEFYEMYKENYPDDERSFEELESLIILTLQQQKQQEAIGILIEDLRGRAEIEYFLDNLEE
jgi:hypothetical protein